MGHAKWGIQLYTPTKVQEGDMLGTRVSQLGHLVECILSKHIIHTLQRRRKRTDQQSPSMPRTAPNCEHSSDVVPILSNCSRMSSAHTLSLDLALSIFWARNACKMKQPSNVVMGMQLLEGTAEQKSRSTTPAIQGGAKAEGGHYLFNILVITLLP